MTSLLYLHGVGQSVRGEEWLDALNASLEAHGIPPLKRRSKRLIAPDYVDLLKHPPTEETKGAAPKVTRHRLPRERVAELPWEYARTQAAAVRGLTHTTDAAGLATRLPHGADLERVPLPADVQDALRYLGSPPLRHAVLQRVLSALDGEHDLVVVAHSLGSVVAVDLLRHLPAPVSIHRLITLGSPLGQLLLHKGDPQRLAEGFPYAQVSSWVNVLSPWDPVTLGLGAAPLFPAAADVRVTLPPGVHAASRYLVHPAVAQLLARALGPVRTTYSSATGVDVRVSNEEQLVLNGLAYAGLVRDRLRGDRQRRYSRALESVQTSVVEALVQARVDQGRPVPGLLLDARDGERVPELRSSGDLEQDLAFTIMCATSNPVAPYDLDVETLVRDVERTWAALGYLPAEGKAVAASLAEAREVFRATSWRRYAVGAAGLALIVAAPVGLALAVPAGLAGAAAITSALAAFGPGGMLGGMVLAGGLVGAGSMTTAVAVVSGMTADMMETEVVRRMALSLARKRIGVEDDGSSWLLLADWHSHLTAELARHRPVSDPDSPTVKTLERKITIADKAIRWMADHGLTPVLHSPPGESDPYDGPRDS